MFNRFDFLFLDHKHPRKQKKIEQKKTPEPLKDVGLTLLTQKSSAFSHGAPAPVCSASAAILTWLSVCPAASVIKASIMAR